MIRRCIAIGLGCALASLGIAGASLLFMWGARQLYPSDPLQCPQNSHVYGRWDTSGLVLHCFDELDASEGTGP